MKRSILPLSFLCIFLSACFHTGSSESIQEGTSSQSSSEVIRETPNVSYEGILSPLDISVYQQGSHRLELGDGRMLLLESQVVDFTKSIGHRVEVYGALRPTVEDGGIIMRVERLTDFSPSSASKSSSVSSYSSALSFAIEVSSVPQVPPILIAPSSSVQSSLSSKAAELPVVSSVARSSASATLSLPSAPASSAQLSSLASSKAPASSSAAAANIDSGTEAKIILASKADLAESKWTQKYCTEHIGFCIPIHKNWWYVSFGAKADTLWHVEVSPEDFSDIGQGIISIDVVGGTLASIGTQDNSVRIRGTQAIGYRDWTQGRHFEISGDARLESAIRYMTTHLSGTASPSNEN